MFEFQSRWPPLSTWLFAATSAGYTLVFTALYVQKGRLPFSEGIFFQAQLYRMTIGERPYIDFAYYYGPSMIYPAYWLTGLLPVELAYAVAFVAYNIVGLFLLFALMHTVIEVPRRAALWSVFLAVGLFDPMCGLNASLVRYLLPPTVLFLTSRSIQCNGRSAILIAALALTFGVLLSFETAALSVAAACLAILVHAIHRYVSPLHRSTEPSTDPKPSVATCTRPAGRTVLARTIVLGGLSLVTGLVFFHGIDAEWRALVMYPKSAFSFLAGAYNQPVALSLPFLALVAISVPAVASVLKTSISGGAMPLLGGSLLILGLLAQRKIFASVDPVNVALFMLPTLLVCLHAAERSPLRRTAQALLVMIIAVGVMFPLQLYFASQIFPSAWPFSTASVDHGVDRTARPAARPSVESILTTIVQHEGGDRPYLMYGLEYYSMPVYERFRLRYANYFTNLTSIPDPDSVRSAIAELRDSDAVIIMSAADLAVDRSPSAVSPTLDLLARATSTSIPGSRMRATMTRSTQELLDPFFEFVRLEYRPAYELNGFVALESVRRSSMKR